MGEDLNSLELHANLGCRVPHLLKSIQLHVLDLRQEGCAIFSILPGTDKEESRSTSK